MARLDRLLWLFPLTGRCYATDCVRQRRLAFLLPFSRTPCSSLMVSHPFLNIMAKGMTEQSVAEGPEAITPVIAGAHQQLFNAAPGLLLKLDAFVFEVTDKVLFLDFPGDELKNLIGKLLVIPLF